MSRNPGAGPNLLLAAASTLLALLMMGASELALRGLGIGAPRPGHASRLKYQQIHLPILAPDRRPDGTPVWRPADIRLPFQSLRRERPPDGVRVLVLGGSAAAGLGYSPNVTFARYLETMLRAADPERSVEILNLGIVALASQQVKWVLADACERTRPDVAIVYSGNNEFLELHAAKFADRERGWADRLRDRLARTHLRRLADAILHGPPQAPPLEAQDFSNDDLRLSESRIIRDIEVSAREETAVLEAYAENLDEMVRTARACGAVPLLMTVASNWRWRGQQDPPPDDRSAAQLSAALARAEPRERAELLFSRARARERAGDPAAARADYRAAMNADPHRRRALDAGNARVRRVAARHGAPLVDSVALLAAAAPHGIVGFEAFYDYVHLTPEGALRLAGALFDALVEQGRARNPAALDPERFRTERLAELRARRTDAFARDAWLGFSFDPARIADRDLWKYERMQRALDARLERDPRDLAARVYRGNAHAFRLLGARAAERDYRAALERAPGHPVIRANLERLLAEARPGRAESAP